MGNPDGSGKARVERGRPFVRRNAVGIRSVCMKNLAQSMNAGVCPAGTVDTAGGSKESGKGSFQHVLDGTASYAAVKRMRVIGVIVLERPGFGKRQVPDGDGLEWMPCVPSAL